jgi:hypothetical protein
MLAELRMIPQQAAVVVRSGRAGFCRAGGLAALVALCGSLFTAPTFGQDAAPTAEPDPSVLVSPPPASSTPPAPATPPAWGPSLDWAPHKPGLPVESDCFLHADLALVFPHLSSLLTAPVRLREDGPVKTVALGNAGLDATVSPSLQIGAFRFGPGYGELAFSYRFLATEGTDVLPAFDGSGAGVIRSRLNLQTFSLDYLRKDCPLGWDTTLSWEVGARLQVVFFDTQAQTAASFQQARNYFLGAGPHAGFTVTRAMPSGLGLFGHFDAALLGGYNTAQNFVVTVPDPQNDALSGTERQQQSQFAPSLAAQVGLSWTPAGLPHSCLRGGYQFEQWYNLGRVEGSRGDLNAHGVFVSWEWRF